MSGSLKFLCRGYSGLITACRTVSLDPCLMTDERLNINSSVAECSIHLPGAHCAGCSPSLGSIQTNGTAPIVGRNILSSGMIVASIQHQDKPPHHRERKRNQYNSDWHCSRVCRKEGDECVSGR